MPPPAPWLLADALPTDVVLADVAPSEAVLAGEGGAMGDAVVSSVTTVSFHAAASSLRSASLATYSDHPTALAPAGCPRAGGPWSFPAASVRGV